MIRRIRLTEQKKIQILNLQPTCTYGRMSQVLNVPRSTIYFFTKRVLTNQKISNIKPPGRPSILSKYKRKIENYIYKHPKLKYEQYITDLNLPCSRRTFERFLKKNKYKRFSAIKKQPLNVNQMQERLNFGKKYLNW